MDVFLKSVCDCKTFNCAYFFTENGPPKNYLKLKIRNIVLTFYCVEIHLKHSVVIRRERKPNSGHFEKIAYFIKVIGVYFAGVKRGILGVQ